MGHAESDLRLARLAAGDPFIRREQVCFHAQQAAEKAMKAALLARHIEFPLTHDIEALLQLAEESGLVLPEAVREAGLLTPYAVQTRYPGSWTNITESDVDEALQAAEHMLAWVKSMLSTGRGA
ncbi:MAG: DNA-binding protein [Candidatus Methylomirabilota bacterium]|nr:HEPN domain-containing protein [Candidatus Methylomirabilis sp.]NJD69297.1 HEPN domain-containing protein [candidate division NC10 bacterium]PWB45369.1 MAG: DNA-binding protein [candidate division NC10 bacterium]